MLHIKPIQPQSANQIVSSVYKEIRQILLIDAIPLVFQYMANYEDYLLFMWDRMKANIASHGFQEQTDEIGRFSAKAIIEIYQPSSYLFDFMKQFGQPEQKQIAETVNRLMHVNTTLFLLTLDLREGMKSIFIGTQRITQFTSQKEENFNEFMDKEMGLSVENQSKQVQDASKMLAPLFGTNALIVSHYPDFFSHIAIEMEKLKNTQEYLEKRVEMERMGLHALSSFVQPLGCSYQEFLTLVSGKEYVSELVYLLTDTFPSQFPHLVSTTSLMQLALHLQENSLVM